MVLVLFPPSHFAAQQPSKYISLVDAQCSRRMQCPARRSNENLWPRPKLRADSSKTSLHSSSCRDLDGFASSSGGGLASCSFQRLLAASRSTSLKTSSNTSEYQFTAWPSMPSLIFCSHSQPPAHELLPAEKGRPRQSHRHCLDRKERRRLAARGATHLGQFQPVRHIVGWEDDHLRARTTSSHGLLSQAANAQHFARDRQLARHGDRGIERGVQGEGK